MNSRMSLAAAGSSSRCLDCRQIGSSWKSWDKPAFPTTVDFRTALFDGPFVEIGYSVVTMCQSVYEGVRKRMRDTAHQIARTD
ncbi:hypothetical protein ACFFNY_25000 [Paenibacillus hodogayensis]|uniref:Uncharacterized protein n=1 Tax=Paenibacillus hodogayensis TaxID=279208 RepID=A0ABV5W2Q0_9BACL